MVAYAGRSASASLIDEIREQHLRVEAERRALRRKRRRRRVFAGLVGGVALVCAGVGVHHAAQRNRIEQRMEVARAALGTATPTELSRAAAALGSNLAVAPLHRDSLGMLALVRVHQYMEGAASEAVVREAIDEATHAGRAEASLARGMMAGLQGDFDEARRTYEAEWAPSDTTREAVLNDRAWLRGVVALGRPYEGDAAEAARKALLAALERDPAWNPNRRLAAALLYWTGRGEAALELVEAGREQDRHSLGLAVDEVLLHALLGRQLDGVEAAAKALLEEHGLSATDAALVKLALAAVYFAEDKAERAGLELDEAWAGFPAWNNAARDIAIDLALTHGQRERVEGWLEETQLGTEADAIYEGWLALVEGDTKKALEVLRAAPQTLPRVAHLQALALVEQRRWQEAATWLDYASETLGHRLDMQVARARVALADPSKAEAVLTELGPIAERDPNVFRVWTAQAQAHHALEHEVETKTALEQAIAREAQPAEAYLLRGELLAAEAEGAPEAAAGALAAFEAAAKANPHDVRYASRLGRHLKYMGETARAREVLAEATALERATTDGAALLDLAELQSRAVLENGAAIQASTISLLQRAAATSVDPDRIRLEQARDAFARGDTPTARQLAEMMISEHPRHRDARVLLAEVLLADGELDLARDQIRTGIRLASRHGEGPLYILWARLEQADGNERRAASLAFKGWRKLPRAPESPEAMLRLAPYVADLWQRIENSRGARTVARELTKHVPHSVDAWVLRGAMEFADGSNDEGCEAAVRALELAPEHPGAIAVQGDCLVRKYDFDAARKAYAQAADLAEGTAEAREYRRKLKRL